MITALLFVFDSVICGGEALFARWRPDTAATHRVDLTASAVFDEAQLNIYNFTLHPLEIQNALRDRHPAKLEALDDPGFNLLKGLVADSTTIDYNRIPLVVFMGNRLLLTYANRPSPFE